MAEKIDHASRAHAVLSASSSARWLKCPPSAAAALLYENADTAYTREGTLAHEVAEYFVGVYIETGSDDTLADFKTRMGSDEVTMEMLQCAAEYRDYIHELVHDENAVVLLEQRVDFSPWVPGGFGTCDCLIIQGNRMDVIDYKYGQGVPVSAVENSQRRLYALGALHDFGDIYEIQEVGMHIFQPRLNNVSVDAMLTDGLRTWGGEVVKPTALLAAEGKGDACAGEHCRFCPHAGACPTLSAACLRVVNTHDGKAAVPIMAPWMVADVLRQEPMISAWLKAVKDRALAAMLDGEEVPGFKVVEGRGSRDWSEAFAVIDALVAEGYSKEQITTEPQLLSPAAMEKALGKKRVAELVGSLIVSKPGSPTVALEGDKRKPFDRLAEAKKDFT